MKELQTFDALQLQKIDLHVHLEGTISPELLTDLCRKYHVAFPFAVTFPSGTSFPVTSEVLHTHCAQKTFREFISYFLARVSVLRDADDIVLAATTYIENAQRENVVGAEMYFSPWTYQALGRNIDELFEGLVRAQVVAKQKNFALRWIFDIVRGTSQCGDETLAFAQRARNRGVAIRTIGLAGDESLGTFRDYTQTMARARTEGFDVVVHAGETGSAKSVLEAVEYLKPSRIGHALCILESRKLRDAILKQEIVVELCPWSNVLLGIVSPNDHPATQIVEAGFRAVVCSDDPGVFGKSLLDNFFFCTEHGVSSAHLQACAQRSIRLFFNGSPDES